MFEIFQNVKTVDLQLLFSDDNNNSNAIKYFDIKSQSREKHFFVMKKTYPRMFYSSNDLFAPFGKEVTDM